jgi:polysaccharide biosynthesis/export protein
MIKQVVTGPSRADFSLGPPWLAVVPIATKSNGTRQVKASVWAFAFLLIPCLYVCGCAFSTSRSRPDPGVRPVGPYMPPQPSQLTASNVNPPNLSVVQSCRVRALVAVWRQRENASAGDLPVGPGDVIDVSVAEIDELQNRKVRVSARGDVELPLIGTVQAAGLDESALHDALVRKLKVYMKNPRVQLFVENYRSRGVAIMGAVQKPGYYDIAHEKESLVAMIGQAGGLSPAAAQKIIFSPAQPKDLASSTSKPEGLKLASAGSQPLHPSAAGEPLRATSAAPRPSYESNAIPVSADAPAAHSIVLNIDGGDAACLDLPARPGDVIIVPIAGEVMVDGWVQNPGAFAITPGMTILGAVSAAGGEVFSWWVELLRTDQAGARTITHYSLSELKSGKHADPLVQSGDVILVEKTLVGAVPYTLYEVFTHFGTGLALPVL